MEQVQIRGAGGVDRSRASSVARENHRYSYHDGLFSNLMNDSSLVFSVTTPNKKVLFLGDLGPEGGDKGGTIVVTGTPEEVSKCEQSYTGKYLKHYFENR